MSRWTDLLMPHLLLVPILLPMLTGGLMLLMKEEHRRTKLVLNITSTTLGLVVGATLLVLTALAHQSVRSHRFHARATEDLEAAGNTTQNGDR